MRRRRHRAPREPAARSVSSLSSSPVSRGHSRWRGQWDLFPLLAPDFSGSFELYGLFAFVSAIVILVTALAALVCGTIGLVRVRPRRSLTVIATTIAALIVFDTVFFGVLGLSTGFLAGRF